jgi:ATP-binding cassette subfamily F protein 3
MELVRFTGLARHYGAKDVFDGLSGVVRAGDHIALVGPNGAGKSTLVRLLAGRDEPDAGTIARARGSRMGYLAQDAAESGPATLRVAFDEALARGGAPEWEMRATLNRFDFDETELDRPLDTFSGGQRTRALLARTLLESPDWLVLDEPTNHLDLDTVRWLETTVARDPRAFLIVSHDRWFLETVATQIWELDGGELVTYEVQPGRAYTSFLEQREARREQQRRAYEAATAERGRQRAVIDELKTHGSHNYSAVRSRELALERVEVAEGPRRDRRAIGVALTAARRATTGWAVDIVDVAKAYDRTLFSGVRMRVARGERVAIVGPNGAGKTTLLQILVGTLAPDRGNVRYGVGLTTASYSQTTVDDLVPSDTAAEAVMRMGVTDEQARGLLGRLNLGGNAGDKLVGQFSGGERRRIMLARLMAQRADCLFLDEPTNDLDIPSREALEEVLASYDGALFVVSHDRFLLARLAQRVISIRDGAATIVDGDYATYERLQHEQPIIPSKARPEPVEGSRDRRQSSKTAAVPRQARDDKPDRKSAHDARQDAARRKRAAAVAEQRVGDLEREKTELERRFSAPDLYDDPANVVRLQHEIERVRGETERALAVWEAALRALED